MEFLRSGEFVTVCLVVAVTGCFVIHTGLGFIALGAIGMIWSVLGRVV